MGVKIRVNTQTYALITSVEGERAWGEFRYSATKNVIVYQLIGGFDYNYSAMKVVKFFIQRWVGPSRF